MGTAKPKAAVIYLAGSRENDVANLVKSLTLLNEHFARKYKYPVVVFHEDYSADVAAELGALVDADVSFQQVSFQLPEFLAESQIPTTYMGVPLSYRHMCRFFGGTVYSHPALECYDWYWRLDTDSFLLGEVRYDPFEFMRKNNLAYGYIHEGRDNPEMVKGLWRAARAYIKANRVRPTFLRKHVTLGRWDRSYYYTNFEISSFELWRSKQFQDFFAYLGRTGGIYKYRWGDAPIHHLAVSMFLPEARVHRFTDIPYQHAPVVVGLSNDETRTGR